MIATPNMRMSRRKGVILLVVLAMLVLLTIIGITFVSYAQSLEAVSEASLDSENGDTTQRFDPGLQASKYWNAETALSQFVGQLGFDIDDDTGRHSVLRGHTLARDLYGASNIVDVNGNVAFPLDRPFGSSGYADPTQPNFLGQASVNGQPNVPYTAPDTRHWFLANLEYDAQGKLYVKEPSFWRNIPSCTSPTNISQTFRYRPNVEMTAGFPIYPAISHKYDVVNLPGGTKEDSIWIDINAPVITLPNGKKIKPMVAPLIIDLDGRLNLGIAGNKMANGGGSWVHGSHEGYGPWEGNVDKLVALLRAQGDPNLTVDSLQAALLATKYGSHGYPYGSTQTGGGSGSGGASGYSPRAHNQVDFNGGVDPITNGLTGPVPSMLPGSGGSAQPFQAFPFFHPGMYGNWAYNETTQNGQAPAMGGIYVHPNAYNPNFPQGSNLAYAIRDMGPLLLWRSDKDNFARDQSNNTPTKQGLASVLGNYGLNGYRPNFFDHVTLLSADFDKPGLYPFVDSKTARGLQWATPGSLVQPSWPRRVDNSFTQPPVAEQNSLGLATRELTRFARINLASFGPDYPEIDPTTGQYIAGSTGVVTQADQGRSLLAMKVVEGLCAATGSFNPFAQDLPTDWYDDTKPNYFFTGSNNYYKASIWLVQLAANIVDFVDPDDVMTQIVVANAMDKGHSSRTVYGTELPKVVINELYAQVDNSNFDYGKTSGPASDDFKVSLFFELLNPLNDPTPPLASNVNRPNTAYIQVKDPATSYVHTVYEIELTSVKPAALYDPFQTDLSGVVNSHIANGFPSPANHVLNSWTDSTGAVGNVVIYPGGSKFNTAAPNAGADGFLWIGPDVTTNIQNPTLQGLWKAPNTLIPLAQPNRLQYTWENGKPVTEPTVLMRRLANPGLQVGPNNPYVLVDFVSVKKDMIEDGRKRDASVTFPGGEKAVGQRNSYGRRQPFAGKDFVDFSASPPDLGAYYKSAKNNGTTAPLHTFGALNFTTQPTGLTNSAIAPAETAETPDWLSHFDRVPASPLSLLMVSTYRPHELTQKFLDQIQDPGDPTKKVWVPHQHAAAWMDEMTGLQRFFELAQTHGEHALTQTATNQPISLFPKGGRLMGRVNLNTVPIYWNATANRYQSPVLEALFDSNPSNRFSSPPSEDTIRSLINDIGAFRASGNYFYGSNPLNRLGSVLQSKTSPAAPTSASYDPWQYYQNLGAGVYQPFNGNLLFDPFALNPAAQPNGSPIRASTLTTHPLVRLEALEKIYNQTTNRSNVFAIWLTVGFFEVVSMDSGHVPPVVLGAEYGSANGRNVRIKSFSIVDRTKIYAYETALTAAITPSINAATGDLAWGVLPINATAPFKNKFGASINVEPRTQKAYNLLTLAQAQPLVLTIDPDLPTEETVEVFEVSGQLQAQFQKAHAKDARVVSRGNPGPMKNYSVNQDKDFVVYWTILE